MKQNNYQIENLIIDRYNSVYKKFQSGNFGNNLLLDATNELHNQLKAKLSSKDIDVLNKLFKVYEYKSDIERQFMFINGAMDMAKIIEYVDMEHINYNTVKKELESILNNFS